MNSMRKRYITIIMAMMLLPMVMGAQALKGSYFLDNSLLRTRLNPAFAPRANYLNLPVISNVGIGLYGSVGPSTFLYPKDGQLYTFLNQNVSVEEFSKKLVNKPGMNMDIDTDILSFGFYTSKNAFWSVDVGLKIDAELGIPRDLLMFMKQGMPNPQQVYSLSGFNIYQTASAYASLGHSRDLSKLVKGLRVGAKARFYLPVEHIGATLGNSQLVLSQDQWTVKTDANAVVAASFLELHPDALFNEESEQELMKMDMSNLGFAGFGLAFDLGAEYRLSVGSVVDGMTFSLSVTDLGAYKFSGVQKFVSQGDAVYEGLKDIEMSEGMDFSESVNGIMEEFLGLANLEEAESDGVHTISTGPKFYAGVEYPFLKDKMSVGLLYSGRVGYAKMLNELTLSYNLTPSKWFNLGLNWSCLNSWKTLGWMMEFTPKAGLNFFIGSDYTFMEVMPVVYLPVDKLWVNARFGLTFMLGSKHGR